jgi:uncharacterized protein
MADPISVVRNDAQHRYDAIVDGKVAGSAHYRVQPGKLIFYHTEVGVGYEGRGVGGTLVRSTLDDVRARGEKITAECPFVAAFLKRHPEYEDLVLS